MLRVKERVFTQEDATKLVQRMIQKGTLNYIIRDALMEKGFSVYEANALIRELRKKDMEQQNRGVDPSIVGYGLAIITIIMLVMVFFLLIAPVQ